MSVSPVVAHQHTVEEEENLTLSTGVKARIIPVAASLIDTVANSVQPPKVPIFHNDEKDRDEENPNDPEYIAALLQTRRERGQAIMDTMVMFGVELVDGLPKDGVWLRRLKFLEKRKQLDLSGYDLEDEFDLEFLFKKYIATGVEDLTAIGRKAGINREAIEQAAQSFQS